MPRYIDADKLLEELQEEIDFKSPMYTEEQNKYLGIGFRCAYRDVAKIPSADVVPRSECVKWYAEYHKVKEDLKQEIIYHRATEKLADKYLVELKQAKQDVAREIFEEIENKLSANMSGEFIGDINQWYDYFETHLAEDIAELKKKYIGE